MAGDQARGIGRGHRRCDGIEIPLVAGGSLGSGADDLLLDADGPVQQGAEVDGDQGRFKGPELRPVGSRGAVSPKPPLAPPFGFQNMQGSLTKMVFPFVAEAGRLLADEHGEWGSAEVTLESPRDALAFGEVQLEPAIQTLQLLRVFCTDTVC